MKIKLVLVSFFVLFIHNYISAADYFWVGGSGLWSEVNGHWATTSGGNTFHAIVPTSQDNIIFDENSFTAPGQTVTLDGSFANCANMDWSAVTNEPEFTSNTSGTLYIFGSLTFSDNMLVNLDADIKFQSSLAGQTIYTGGNLITSANVSFDNANGSWELLDSLKVGTEIALEAGALTTNGNTVVANNFTASDGIFLDMENSIFHMSTAHTSSWRIYGTNSELNTLNSTIYAYSVGVGTGYDFNDIVVTSNSIYGDSAQINNLTFSSNATINITNSHVNNLLVEGVKTTINEGPNFFRNAEIASTKVTYPSPAWYDDYSVDQIYDSLVFTTPGVVISMDASTQKVNQYFNIAGDCENYSEIKSLVEGSPVEFDVPVDVSLEFIQMTDIHISGGATYTISNAVDNGGNTGWTISEIASKDLYWIGGSSNNWNDGNNWSLTSGGAPYGCSPTIKDNVFFDANSFSGPATVEINSKAFANNIDWTGALFNPELKGSESLNINGSLTMIENMQVGYYGPVSFVSCSVGNTIKLNGSTPTNGSIRFNCKDGEWSLLDSLIFGSSINLQNGSLIADQVKISADQFIVHDSTSLSLENSEVEVTYFDGWEIGSGVALNAATTSFHMNSGQYYSIPNFSGGKGYTYGNIYLESDPSYMYNIICEECLIDSVIGVTGGGRLSITNTTIDYVNLVSPNGEINSNGTFIKELVVNTTEQMRFNTRTTTDFKKLTVETLDVQNPAVKFVVKDTLEVTDALTIPSNCNTFFSIKSNTSGEPAYLIVPDNLILEYVSIRDITVGNGSNYQALNSIDEGGNTNWQFTELSGRKLYWIGGEGTWEDGNNWSLTSGGAPLGCVPSPLDTAIFDENSFDQPNQTVTVSAGININTMDWSDVTNQPSFVTTGDLNFNGSLIYSENMEVNTPSAYLFNSCAEGNIIKTGNHKLTDHYDFPISFNCSTGSWSLQDTLSLDAELLLNKGHLITNGNTLKVRYFSAKDNTGLDIRDSDILITYAWELEGSNVDFEAEGSYIFSTYSTFQAGESYDYWDVEFHRGSGYSPPSITGSDLTFNKVIMNDVTFSANNSVVDSLITVGEKATISGNGNKYIVADLNSSISVTISKAQEFDVLNVNIGGLNVIYQSDDTQTINKEFNIVQEPSFPIYFSATEQGTQANINFLGTKPPCSEFLFLRDNNIYGPSNIPFYAGLDSDDIDNNTGWVFETNADCNTLLCEFEGVELDLGEDVPLFCVDHTLETKPLNLNEKYQWQIISEPVDPKDTLTAFTITESATVVLTLSTEICTISDTVVATKGDCSVIPFEICEGDSVLLKPSLADDTHLWNTGSTKDSIYVKTDGFFWVDNDDGTGTIVRDSFYVEVNAYPQFDLGNDTILCNTSFSYTLPPGLDSFTWSFGGTNPSFTIDTSAYIWAEVEKNNCVVRDTILIQVDSIDFTGFGRTDTTLCSLKDTISYGLDLNNLSYVWEDGETGYETGQKDITQPGVYWVEVFSDLGCKVRDSITVNLSDIEPINLGNDTLLCNAEELELSISNNYDLTRWSDNEQDYEMTVDAMGKYWVGALKGSCVVSDTIIVNKVVVSFGTGLGKDTTLCSGDSLYWNETLPANLSYVWEDGTSGTTQMERTIKDAGIYWLEIDSYGCTARDSIEIKVVNTSAISLGNDTVLCDGASLNLSASSVYDSYEWSTGANGNSISIYTADTYWLTVTQDNCEASDTIVVSTAEAPVFSLGNDTTLCPGNDLIFKTDSAAVNYTWDNGLTGNDFVDRTVSGSGVYWLELENMGCTSRDSILISVLDFNESGLGTDTILCTNTIMDLTVNSGFDTYEWSTGDLTNTTEVATEGIYWVELTQNNCMFRDSITVTDFALPSIFENKDTTFCPNNFLIIEETFSGLNYEWEDGSNGFEDVYREINQAGLYWLELSSGVCSVRDTLKTKEEDVPVFSIGNDTSICSMETLVLNLPKGFTNPVWDNGSTTSSYLVDESGLFSVNAKWENCAVYDDIYVDLVEDLCPEDPLIFPTAFTPNGDGVNDTWVIDGLEKYPNSRVQIFNRWGHLIFESNNYQNQWDGEDLPMGTYYYALWNEESNKEITGAVTILRME